MHVHVIQLRFGMTCHVGDGEMEHVSHGVVHSSGDVRYRVDWMCREASKAGSGSMHV